MINSIYHPRERRSDFRIDIIDKIYVIRHFFADDLDVS